MAFAARAGPGGVALGFEGAALTQTGLVAVVRLARFSGACVGMIVELGAKTQWISGGTQSPLALTFESTRFAR